MSNSGTPRPYRRHRDVREDDVDGILFLIDEDERAIHALEPLGRAIWHMLRQPTAMDEMVSLVNEAFPAVSRNRVAADVRRLLADLEDSNLITRQ